MFDKASGASGALLTNRPKVPHGNRFLMEHDGSVRRSCAASWYPHAPDMAVRSAREP